MADFRSERWPASNRNGWPASIWNAWPASSESALKRISADIANFRELILPARNRFISHLDLQAIRLGDNLGVAPMNRWQQFWLDLQDFLDLMYRHHVDPNGHFYLNAVSCISDADSLITALRNAQLFDAVMSDTEIATRAIRAADKSKFAGEL